MVVARWLLALLVFVAVVPVGQAQAQEDKSFTEQGFGYTLAYPGTWSLDRPGAYTLVLRPPPEAADGPVAVSVENVHLPAGTAVDAVVDRYLAEMREAAMQIEVHRQAPFRWDTADGQGIAGRQVVADFTRDGLPFRQWAVVLPSPLAPVAHVWLFTAPQSLFDDWRPPAEGILRSLRPAAAAAPAR